MADGYDTSARSPAAGEPPEAQSGWFLADPNYYRLSYQLAAQYMSAALSSDLHDGRHLVGQALETGVRLIREAERKRDYLAGRKWSARKWRPWRALDPAEDRLLRFLDRTIVPCAALVVAGAFDLLGDSEEAERFAEPIRARAAEADLSYRALYNLACYEASRAGTWESSQIDVAEPGAVALALAYLDEALTQAPDDRAVELARWAKEDPSLQRLEGDARTRLTTIANRYLPSGTDDQSGPAA